MKSNEGTTSCCAACGATEGDGIKLRTCNACKSVKYCGVKCQKEHRSKHKRECKKRAAELKDETLFKQPESTCFGDCPICFLPLPLDQSKSTLMECCSKKICQGCSRANLEREENNDDPKCPFCRSRLLMSLSEINKRKNEKLAKMNDPVFLCHEGIKERNKEEYETAFTYLSKAAELGDAVAHYELSYMYTIGRGVGKNDSKAQSHLEQAAIGGVPHARAELGHREAMICRPDRAVKHWIIGASHGGENSLKHLKSAYEHGLITKDAFASSLRAYQDFVDATKSQHRTEAASFFSSDEPLMNELKKQLQI